MGLFTRNKPESMYDESYDENMNNLKILREHEKPLIPDRKELMSRLPPVPRASEMLQQTFTNLDKRSATLEAEIAERSEELRQNRLANKAIQAALDILNNDQSFADDNVLRTLDQIKGKV